MAPAPASFSAGVDDPDGEVVERPAREPDDERGRLRRRQPELAEGAGELRVLPDPGRQRRREVGRDVRGDDERGLQAERGHKVLDLRVVGVDADQEPAAQDPLVPDLERPRAGLDRRGDVLDLGGVGEDELAGVREVGVGEDAGRDARD